MRLIDADVFRREIDNHWPFTKEEQRKHGIADMAKSTLLVVLNNMPTIDAVPTGIIEEVYADILGAECGDSWIQCDGIMVNTDVGYAMDGVDLFFKLLMKRIYGEVSDE